MYFKKVKIQLLSKRLFLLVSFSIWLSVSCLSLQYSSCQASSDEIKDHETGALSKSVGTSSPIVELSPTLLKEIDPKQAQEFFKTMRIALGSLYDNDKKEWIAGDKKALEEAGNLLGPAATYLRGSRRTLITLQGKVQPLLTRISKLEEEKDELQRQLAQSQTKVQPSRSGLPETISFFSLWSLWWWGPKSFFANFLKERV